MSEKCLAPDRVMAVHLKPYLQEGVVAIVDEGQVLQPTNPVRNALNKEARHLHNSVVVKQSTK